MRMKAHSLLVQACLSVSVLAVTGCNLNQFSATSTASLPTPRISGSIYGGQQPVSNAEIRLYAANTSTLRGASTNLMHTTITTDANGNFVITGAYDCPGANALVYLVSLGGNPGLASGTNNTGLVLSGALGTCGTLQANAATTHVVINELTTVAMIESLAQYMTDYEHLGATDASLLAGAFDNIQSIVSTSIGNFTPRPAGSATAPITLYSTLANILASCVNTASISSANCAKLYGDTGSVSNTFAAMNYIAQHPGSNVADIFTLAGGTGAPFQPALPSAPKDFSSSLVIQLPKPATTSVTARMPVTIDGNQNVWVGTSLQNAIYEFDNNGNLLHTFTTPNSSPGSANGTFAMTTDSNGDVWALTGNYYAFVLNKFSKDGAQISPASGWTTKVVAGSRTIWANSYAIRSDSDRNLWATAYDMTNTNACFEKFDTNGNSLLTSCFPVVDVTGALAVDELGNAYMTSAQNLYKVDKNGVDQFSPSPKNEGTYISSLRYDPINKHLWTSGAYGMNAFNQDGSKAIGPVTDVFNLENPVVYAFDATGNLWCGNSATAGYNNICELSPSGTLLSPTAFPTPGGYKPAGLNYLRDINIDGYGNIWITNSGTATASVPGWTLMKVPSLSLPRAPQYY